MFCQLFSLQNKSFLCLQHVENKGFQTVIKHRLKAIQKHIKNELGNREKNTKKCTFRFEKMHISFSRLYTQSLSRTRVDKIATIPINEILAHIIQGLTIWRLNGT